MHRLIPILILAVALTGCAGNSSMFQFTAGQSSVSTTVTETQDSDGNPVKVTLTELVSDGVSEFFAFGIIGNTVRAASNAFLAFMGRAPAPEPASGTED